LRGTPRGRADRTSGLGVTTACMTRAIARDATQLSIRRYTPRQHREDWRRARATIAGAVRWATPLVRAARVRREAEPGSDRSVRVTGHGAAG